MLNSLPKLADKAFVLGFLLPTSLFVIAFLATIARGHLDPTTVQALLSGDITKLVYFILAVWLLSVFMLLLNTSLYRVLEGYTWPLSRCGWLKANQERQFSLLDDRVKEFRQRRQKDPDSLSATEEEELQDKWVELKTRFPSEKSILLPTEFGNAILAFEHYPKEVYDADGVTLWPHLSAVVPKEFQANIGDARAQVDALVNLVFFAIALAAMAALLLAWHVGSSLIQAGGIAAIALAPRNIELLLVALIGIIVGYASYRFAVQKAYSWGNWVRAAFDCYLPALAKTLGLRLPPEGEEQRAMWRSVVFRAALNLPFNPAPWALTDTAGVASVEGKAASDGGDKQESGEEPESDAKDE